MAQQYLFHTSLAHRLRLFAGQIFVEHHELGVVFEDGRFSRLLSPGYHALSRLSGEELAGKIPIRKRVAHLSFDTYACDGFRVKGVVSVYYIFNPGEALPNKQEEAACLGLEFACSKYLETAVQQAAKKGISHFLRRREACDLLRGEEVARLEQEIALYIRDVLAPEGILVSIQHGVAIDALEVPHAVQRMMAERYAQRPPAESGTERHSLRPPANRPTWPSV